MKHLAHQLLYQELIAHARNNPEFVGKEESFYKNRVFIPYYQWLRTNNRKCLHSIKLLPSFGENMPIEELRKVLEPMDTLLPFSSLEIEAQMKIWAEKKRKGEVIPDNAVDSLAHCNIDLIQAMFSILQIFSTIPITTTTSEITFSTMKRIKTYLRNSMGDK